MTSQSRLLILTKSCFVNFVGHGVRVEWHFHKTYAPLNKRAFAITRDSFR